MQPTWLLTPYHKSGQLTNMSCKNTICAVTSLGKVTETDGNIPCQEEEMFVSRSCTDIPGDQDPPVFVLNLLAIDWFVGLENK